MLFQSFLFLEFTFFLPLFLTGHWFGLKLPFLLKPTILSRDTLFFPNLVENLAGDSNAMSLLFVFGHVEFVEKMSWRHLSILQLLMPVILVT